MDNINNNQRIAKNTLFMYSRMLLVMLASIITVRIVLNALGSVDYGLNNVVGGVVAMFSFLTATMTSASLRFFSFELGRGDQKKLSEYFSVTFWCYVGFAAIILVLAETVGLWFVNTQLTIPPERMYACMWVYQASIVSFIINIVGIPYNSLLISHEKMNIYAYIGIIQAILKLVVAYLLLVIGGDKLIIYAILTGFASIVPSVYYIIYGLKKFPESKISWFFDKVLFKEIINYSFWSLFGALSGVLRGQGINILLNIFFGPVVNAARAIAYQVEGIIISFVTNFYQTVYPQITKIYAADEMGEMKKLVFRTSRFCFYLIIIFSIPIFIEAPYLLQVWLKTVPDNTILFTRLVLLTGVVESISYPMMGLVSATGKIKYYQLVTGTLLLLNLPVSWIFLKLGFPAEVTMYVAIGVAIVSQFSRIIFAKVLTNMSIRAYCKEVLLNITMVTIVSLIIPVILHLYLPKGLWSFLITIVSSGCATCLAVWIIGMNKSERQVLMSWIKNKLHIK